MAYFAKLDKENKVIEVIAVGEEFADQFDKANENWIETFKDDSKRYNYAGIGYTYYSDADAFVAPKPQCGHSELKINDKYRWECSNAEHKVI